MNIYKTESGFEYLAIENGAHGRHERVWVNKRVPRLLDERGEVKLLGPAGLRVTEKGNKVLIPGERGYVALIVAPCGYRGSGRFTIRPPEELIITAGEIYESPRGSLGTSSTLLIFVPVDGTKVRYAYHRSGRLYGSPPNVVEEIYFDGKEVVVREVLSSTEDGVDEELLEAL